MKNTKILLLNPPYKEPIIRDNYCCYTSKTGYLWPPIDLLYLSGIFSGLPRTDIHFIDAVAQKQSADTVYETVAKIEPEFIFTLTGTASFRDDMAFLERIHEKLPETALFVLGNTPCFEPKRFLSEFPFLKGILHNFLDVNVRSIVLGDYGKCTTFSYKKNSEYKIGSVNLPERSMTIGGIPPPRYDLLDFSPYQTPIVKQKPLVTVLTSFGCPFNCAFCIASRLNFHMREIEDLRKEFDAIKKYGIREIFFEDSTFNTNPDYLTKVCNLLIDGRYGFSWSANIHSFRVTPSLIRKMKEAGCHTVQIGVESGDPQILKTYAPSKIKEKIAEAVAVCKQEGVKVLGYFIIGFPTETSAQARKTIQFAKQLDPDYASFSTMTPDYGTKVYEDTVKARVFSDKENRLSSFDSSGKAIIQNAKLSAAEQDALAQRAYREFYFRPKKILSYLLDFSRIGIYIRNGIFLIIKKIIN